MAWTKVGNIKGITLTDFGIRAVGQSATLLAIAAGIRTVVVDVPNIPINAKILLTPITSIPDGYLFGMAFCVVVGKMSVPIYAPGLLLGASYSVNCRVQTIA